MLTVRMAPSFHSNFCPPEKFWVSRTDESPKELDRVNRLDAEAVQSAVPSNFADLHGLNGHCCGEATPFFWPFPEVFPRSLLFHSFDCSFISGVKWWIQVSSIVTKRRTKLAEFFLKSFKHSPTFTCMSAKTISWTLSMFSGTTADF